MFYIGGEVMKTKIGIMDSGIGGITVLKKCIDINKDFEYIYYSDSKHNPYGDKSCDDVIRYCDEIVSYLVCRGCKIIILACNTASAIASEYLRNKYNGIDIIAIEPAIKVASNDSDWGTLVMATKGTINSKKFKKLYREYDNNNMFLVSCSGLADLIEKDDIEKIDDYLNDDLYQYRDKVSNVVLGCTHYPLIKNNIRKVLGDVTFYDGSMGVAKRLQKIIKDRGYIDCGKVVVEFLDSTGSVEKSNRFYKILGSDIYE